METLGDISEWRLRFSGYGIYCFAFISVLDFGLPKHIITNESVMAIELLSLVLASDCITVSFIACFNSRKPWYCFWHYMNVFYPKCVFTCNTHLYLRVILLLLNSSIGMNFLQSDCFIYFTAVKAPGEYEIDEIRI